MLKIGHRGACGYELENSPRSFEKALQLRVDVIETDLRLTKDGVPVLFHDATLERVTDSAGEISDYTSDDLRRKVKLKNGEQIPTLPEFFELIAGRGVGVFLDVKFEDSEDILLQHVTPYLSNFQIVIGSFHPELIKNINRKQNGIKTGVILRKFPDTIEQIVRDTGCKVISLRYDSATEEAVRQVRQLGQELVLWTVNDPHDVEKVRKLNPDGIVSDFPGRIG
ncbi:MAG: glycerophosphodiester phosphodiesterase [candidate division Zixibacteria bacterium]|nr:glycerophosphodiester phosphodiesterase [candidate division Zixibacteria bacterium]